MGLIDAGKEWLLSVALQKGVNKAIMAFIAILGTKWLPVLESWGITINLNLLQTALLAGSVGVVEVLRNFLKVKLGVKGL